MEKKIPFYRCWREENKVLHCKEIFYAVIFFSISGSNDISSIEVLF